MNITYKRETWKKCEPELATFWPKHYEQLSVNKDAVPLAMWNERYQQLEDVGVLFLMTIRDEGKLIGYFIGVVQPHLHFKNTLHYFSDLYYLDESYRDKGIGKQGFIRLEEELKSLGVIRVYVNTKVHENHGKVFEKLGFKMTDFQYSKILK